MEIKDFSKFKFHRDRVLNNQEVDLESYQAIISYVGLLKTDGKSNGYLDRFYLVMSKADNKTTEFYKEQRLYFLNVLDDMDIIVSGHFD